MVNRYWEGQAVRVSGSFSVGGVATDPTTVTLKVTDPSGTEATYTYALEQITKSSTGAYFKDVSTDAEGIWYYRFVGTGACAGVDEGSFEVVSNF